MVATRTGLAVAEATNITFSTMSPDYAEMHGYTPDELVGRPLDDLLTPTSRARISAITEMVNTEGHSKFELIHVHRDGSSFPVRGTAVAVRGEAGDVLYYAATIEVLENDLAASPSPAAASEARRKYKLTGREMEVLRLVASGRTDKEIAKLLDRSAYTVHNHVRHILLKMSASSRTDATVRALREGLV